MREFPSGPGAKEIAPHNEAEYMTATGSSLISLQKESCARERSIYVCGELLILAESDAKSRLANSRKTVRVPL